MHALFWDWLFGTLRKRSRTYGEDRFVGEQEVRKGDGDEPAAAPATKKDD